MSEWPASYSCSSAPVPGPRRQSLKGCMGALPQMFQWSRMLGSNNKCIATTSADVLTLPVASDQKQTEIKRWAKQLKPVVLLIRGQQHREEAAAVSNESDAESSSVWKASDSSACREGDDQTAGMVLRQVLHAKQEPFVLQDVIREKRQPVRTHSSRELKFGAPSTRRSRKMKNGTTSKGQGEDGDSAACQSHYCVAPRTPIGSAGAVVRRNRVPVESMVAMPSYQAPAACGVTSTTKAHSKAASQGRNPVKSPNKRALLMEAAARILEGSNHSVSKRPSMTSVRSLLEELEKSKHVKELSKPKEKLVRPVHLHSESSERELVLAPNVVILGKKAAESKQHQNSHDLKLLSKHNSNSSCKHHCEMPHILDKDLLVMQSRVFPYDNALAESLATPVQNPSSEIKSEQVQLHDDLMKETQKETMNQIVRGFKLDASEALLQAESNTVLPEVIITEDQHRDFDHDVLLKDSRAIVPSTSIDSGADFLPVVFSTCLGPSFDNGTPSLIRNIVVNYSLARHFTWSYHAAAPFPVNNPGKSDGSSARSTGRSLIEAADEMGYPYRAREDMKLMEAERQSNVMQLRLCNYSWWANLPQNNSPEKGENQLSNEYCAGYDSPVSPICACFVKVWTEERKDREEKAPYNSCVCVDEFEQASPVSVLEPIIYEEELELGNSFDNFEGAMHKLLEKVRRYEMLAHMDVDMLKKVSEEHAWDDDDNESWETDYSSCSSSSSFQASPAHDSSSSDVVEAQKHFKEPYILFPAEESRLYGQEVEMRPPTSSMDCLAKKLEPRPISCRVLRLQDEGEAPVQSQRLVSGEDHMIKEAGKGSSANSGRRRVVTYVVNNLLHKDLTQSNWSRSKQEEEELELELESCFFDLLMCELLSDLLKPRFCNAFDLHGNPVHNAELSKILPIRT